MNSDLWTIVGTLAGVLSLLVAVVQTLRYREASRLLKEIRQREEVGTWSSYDLIVQAYESIGEARTALRASADAPTAAVEKTAQVASLLNAMWLRTVEQAATLEKSFDEEALKRWVDLGRLDSDWRLARARKLLPTTVDPKPRD